MLFHIVHELFGLNEQQYVWRIEGEAFYPSKVKGIMKKEGYFQIRLGKPKISKMSVQRDDCQKLLNDYQ